MRRMNFIGLKPGIAIVLAFLFALAEPAHADRYRDRSLRQDLRVEEPSSRNPRVSMEEAIASVQQATGGKVLDAKRREGGYRVKVLTRRGEVRVVYVDGRTGELR